MKQGLWKVESHFPAAQGKVLLGLANGQTNKEIAKDHGVSPSAINSAMTKLREKLSGKLEASGKRAWIVSEAIRLNWLTLAMILLCLNTTLFTDLDIRRSTNRLPSRTVQRMTRNKREGLIDDIESALANPEYLMDLIAANDDTNTGAPWSSAAGTQRELNNQDRASLWRDYYDVMAKAA